MISIFKYEYIFKLIQLLLLYFRKRRVAIFDATNTTRDRRLALAQRARNENVSLLFVESICNDKVYIIITHYNI